MSRTPVRRQLSRDGWLFLLLMLLPLLLATRLPLVAEQFGLVFFGLGLASLFLSLPRFTAYKHALIATEKALGNAAAGQAWLRLRDIRRRALLIAALPAWLAAAGAPFGLEAVPQWLLLVASLVLLVLYRIPRQLG